MLDVFKCMKSSPEVPHAINLLHAITEPPTVLAEIFRPYLLLLAVKFSSRICSYLPGFSGVNFSGKGM
jgi:hypothetical protein